MVENWVPKEPAHDCPDRTRLPNKSEVYWLAGARLWGAEMWLEMPNVPGGPPFSRIFILCCPYCGLKLEQPPKEG